VEIKLLGTMYRPYTQKGHKAYVSKIENVLEEDRHFEEYK
jgi:hypothetical protein